MLNNRFTLGTLLAAACGVGLMSGNAQAAITTATNPAVTNSSATDADLNQLGDGVGFGGFAPPTGNNGGSNRMAVHIFEIPNVVDPFVDISAASLDGFLNTNDVGSSGGTYNMDMVFMGLTALNPGVSASDYEIGIGQALSSTDVAFDNWATPASPSGFSAALPSVDILSYVQNNYVAGGGFLKIGLPADQLPAVGANYLGQYRVRGQTSNPFALTMTFDDGAPPPPPKLAEYDFNAVLAGPETGVTSFASVDTSADSTATNVETGMFVLASGLGVPAPSLFHGDPKWIVTSEADALSQGAYTGFEVTPDAGKTLDLSELSADLQMDVAGEGLGEWALYGDLDPSDGLDDFVSLVAGSNTAAGGSSSASSYEHVAIDLTAAQYQGLDGVALRLYRWHDGAFPINATVNSRTDNLVLDGTVIPEPASLILMGLGGLAFLKRRTA